MSEFYEGDWVIDTKRKIAPTIVGTIPSSITELYVLKDDDEYYIEDGENLIEYDKYWFNQESECTHDEWKRVRTTVIDPDGWYHKMPCYEIEYVCTKCGKKKWVKE